MARLFKQERSRTVKYAWIPLLIMNLLILWLPVIKGQVYNNGCVRGNFGIDAGLYSNILEFGDQGGATAAGTRDWFYSPVGGGAGLGIIDTANTAVIRSLLQATGTANPIYVKRMNTGLNSTVNGQIMIDAMFGRDMFGGSGCVDQTSFTSASKNGEDPATWSPGPANVLGKNDILDVAAHMFRDGTSNGSGGAPSDLWFVGMINRAEPGGDAYMDFEFFVEPVTYDASTGFSSGGAQMGHTAFTFYPDGAVKSIGDFILDLALTNGGSSPEVQLRLWMSRADYNANLHPAGFTYGLEFDGAGTGAPYGYARIIPGEPEICGIVNHDNQFPAAPPWGTRGTKSNTWGNTYIPYSVAELGLNLTHFGIDYATVQGADPCYFPIHTFIVKTMSSNSFTAQLKDFVGPYSWGEQPPVTMITSANPNIVCDNPTVTLSVDPVRPDVNYHWSTTDGQINGSPDQGIIQVSKAGTYAVNGTVNPSDCAILGSEITVTADPAKPFFGPLTYSSTVSCNGNDGAIDLSVSGATTPYTYSWTRNGSPFAAGTQDLTGLSAGTYKVTVTDNWGCNTVSAEIPVAGKVGVGITSSLAEIACAGEKTGSVNLTTSGGVAPLTYLWSTGNTSKDLLNVGAGGYTVSVTDANGCKTTASWQVTQPGPVSATILKTNDTNPDPAIGNGTADLTAGGGTPSYSYQWAGPNNFSAASEDISGLKYGAYTVTVTDSHSCLTTAGVFIFEPEICNDGIDNDGDGLNNCNDGDCKPVTPGIVTPGAPTTCMNQSVTYSVPADPSYDSYAWTLSAGGSITGGQGTRTITVTWSSTGSKQVCVQGQKYECLSNMSCLPVTVVDVPVSPEHINVINN